MSTYYSFLICTNKDIRKTKLAYNIYKLNEIFKKNFEILVYSCREGYNLPNTKFFHSKEDYGAVYGLNELVKQSQGKYVIVIPDYAELPNNIAYLHYYLEKCNILAATFTACNHAGPGTRFNNKVRAHCRLTDCTFIQSLIKKYNNDLNSESLDDVPILFFPILRRDLIDKVLDGKIFNPYFKHRWVDNWLSLYLVRSGLKGFVELQDFVCHTGECPFCGPKHKHNAKNDDFDTKVMESLFRSAKTYSEKPDCLIKK